MSHELFNYDLNKQLPKPTSGSAGGADLPQHPRLDESGNFNIRAVERGSKIVTVDPGTRTVLQMPRGNLEGIYPRIILLKKLIEDVENLNYGKAFKALRQHKIDINLLYDVNPEQFIANISKFVTEVDKVDHLNLFINALVDDEAGTELQFMKPADPEDQIRKEHARFFKEKVGGAAQDSSGKVNRICDALKVELLTRNQSN